MDELIKKYHNGTLTSDELRQLREAVTRMTPEEVMDLLMLNPADSNAPTPEEIDVMIIDRMKHRIHADIDPVHTTAHRSGWRKAISVAAAIVIPALLFTTGYLYMQRPASQPFADDILVTTAKGERTTVTLPDGTIATLNGCSSIEFPSRFAEGYRNVRFNGEAFFDVSKSEKFPFDIIAPGMKVEVKGTSFNLLARTGMPMASLTLQSGKVHLVATASNRSIDLTPGQTAILDTADGIFTLDSSYTAGHTAWIRNEMVLKNISPDSLVRCIEHTYDVQLNPDIAAAMDETFTGTLPTNDLFGTLDILSHIYDFTLPYHTTLDYSAYNQK